MCDYSLHANPNRLAQEGEDLVAWRFQGGSMGLASQADVDRYRTMSREAAFPRKPWSWSSIRTWFRAVQTPIEPMCAVCVPPGATLFLMDIPERLRHELGVSEAEEVTFIQTSATEYTHRDGVRFSNGRRILLQSLREGQRVRVFSLASRELETGSEREMAAIDSQSAPFALVP